MCKLRVLSGSEVCAVLARHRFLEVRERGSHVVMQKRLPDTTITVPVPNHAELRIGTLQSIEHTDYVIEHYGTGERYVKWPEAARVSALKAAPDGAAGDAMPDSASAHGARLGSGGDRLSMRSAQ